MQKKSITKNYIYNLLYQVLILLLPLITAPYISRVLGAENIGIYSYTLSISAYFILVGTLGMNLYGQREIAYQQNDKKKYTVTFWGIAILKTLTTVISLLIYYIYFCKGQQYQIYYKILILEIFGNCLDISWFFQGLEEFKKTVIRNVIVKMISIVLIFTLVKDAGDLAIYFVIYVLSILIGNISLWLYLPKFLEKISIKEINIIKHLKPTVAMFIPQIAMQVYTLLDRTMIGAIISDKSEVGYYDQSQKIIKMLLAVITSLGTVMLPRIAHTFANGEKEKVAEYMKKSFRMVFFMAFPMILGCISVAKVFVPVFFGPGYDKVVILMSIISPILLLIGISNVTGMQFLLPTKKQKEFTISVTSGAIINFVLNIFFIKHYGAIGAAITTVIAELTVTMVQLYFVRKEFELKSIFKSSFKYLVSSIVMFGACFIIGNLITNNIISIVLQVSVGAIVYGGSLILMKDEFIVEIFEKVKNKVYSKQ